MACLIAVTKYLTDLGGYVVERHTGGPLSELEAITCAALVADETPAPALIIKAKAFVPATDRAWAMTVLQILRIHP
jgi:uncharacterized membrane protein